MDPYNLEGLDEEPRYWNGPYWLDDALAALPSSEEAEVVGLKLDTRAETSSHAFEALPTTSDSQLQDNVIVCNDVNAICPGRQPTKSLKCGVAGCTTDKLFDRKYELERHMKTHEVGSFLYTATGCKRDGRKPFNRRDKLQDHQRRVHGL
ncbi:uncharacterized protein LTR77_007416 [Saxophila tyrrhenica]|uniref:C2H2-type domain-containing protein n=1 Tax=Saxophila tyrrhenica TaxID=1690608 RepID=A0AAV9P8F4_9PEZI|nr:hypothetical protein LTR77_007416 [Saxophila tyrrhenica]